MKYIAKLLAIFFDRGYPMAPVEVTDEYGNTITYYRQVGGGLMAEDGKDVTDPDILRAVRRANLAMQGLKEIGDDEG